MVSLSNLPLVGGLCLGQQILPTIGLRNLPIVGVICLVQQTSTTMGLEDLPLVGGLCLAQWAVDFNFNHTIVASNDTKRNPTKKGISHR
jgi:hypothetical protein